MKLHLGCGNKLWEGYTNIDLKGGDLSCDIRFLPFDDEVADEIVAIHVCEHFFITEIQNVLAGWKRVLKTGGKLIVELPCWDKVIQHIKNDSPENMTRWALYGEPSTHKDGLPALHKWCYSVKQFGSLLESLEFKDIQLEKPLFHQPSRDMRWVATK